MQDAKYSENQAFAAVPRQKIVTSSMLQVRLVRCSTVKKGKIDLSLPGTISKSVFEYVELLKAYLILCINSLKKLR
jgi:hypothetical protein